MRGSCLSHAIFSLQSIKFSLRSAMEIMFGMFLFEFWVFSNQKYELANFPKFELACMHASPLGDLDMPYLYRAHVPCMRACDPHARCDITRFTNKANHIILTSSVLAFHLCYVGMRWHDVIEVHVS